jgi:hypothetical protein
MSAPDKFIVLIVLKETYMFQGFKDYLLIALLVLMQMGCSSDSGSSSSFLGGNTETQILELTYQAMHSAGVNLISQESTDSLRAMKAAPQVLCNDEGFPVDSEDYVLLPSNDTDYAYKMIYCLATSDSGGPETALGSMQIAKGILCALGNIEYNDKTHQTSYDFTTGTCFNQRISDIFIGFGANPLVVNYIADSSQEAGWDYKIDMQLPQLNRVMSFKYKDSDNIKAAAMSDSISDKSEAWIVSVNTETGDFHYENMSHHLGSSDAVRNNRHARLYMNCEMNETNCGFVKSAEAIWSQTTYENNQYTSRIATLKGNAYDGYATVGYEGLADNLQGLNNANNYTHGTSNFGMYTVDTMTCYDPRYGSCMYIEPITFADQSMEFLLLSDVDVNYPVQWFDQQINQPRYTYVSTALVQ